MVKTLLISFLMLASAATGTPAMAQTTQVVSSQCGSTLPGLGTAIMANIVPGATAYKFKVTLDGNDYVIEKSLRTFKLTDLPVYRFAAAYQVEVAAKVNGVFGPYGSSCAIVAPTPVTSVIDAMCGSTLSQMDQPVYASLVAYAPGYRFRVTNAVNPSEVYIVDRSLREFRMSQLGVPANGNYIIDVAVKNFDGTYLPYGPACMVSTPAITTQITETYCGKYVGSLTETIYANYVSFATRYRFKVTDASNIANEGTVESNLRVFSLSSLPFIQYNKVYVVSVAVKDQSGTWQPYGTPCSIHTPAMPIPKIQLSQCNLYASNMNQQVFADEIPNATVYRFRMQSNDGSYSQSIDRPTRSFTLNMFSGLQMGAEYTIRVSVKVGGTYSSYGKACNIFTPQGEINRQANPDLIIEDELSISPNPFTSSFAIALPEMTDNSVRVSIFDTAGRSIEDHVVKPGQIAALSFGDQLTPGAYVVNIDTGAETYQRKLIKK